MGDLYRRLQARKGAQSKGTKRAEVDPAESSAGEGTPSPDAPGGPEQDPAAGTGADSGAPTLRSRLAAHRRHPRESTTEEAPRGQPPSDFHREGAIFLRREVVALSGLADGRGPGTPVAVPLRAGGGSAALRRARAGRPLSNYIFFDLEATGLSTGAGSVAFLLGFGRVTESGFELVQWLLPDYPYEPELLAAVAEYLAEKEAHLGAVTLVSYNGRSFDTPLLRTRMLMNGIPFEPPGELDLLPYARRLWRWRLDSCSLGSIEESVLSLSRDLDIPGAQVPLRYFDYLNTGMPEGLEPVIAHHRQDILSLYSLLSRLARLFEGDLALAADLGADRFELGKLLVEHEPNGDSRAVGEQLLSASCADGTGVRSALYYGNYLKRRGEYRGAWTVWDRCYRRTGDPGVGVFLAKLAEHQFRTYRVALDLVEDLLGSPKVGSPRLRSELEHRQERLLRRLASS